MIRTPRAGHFRRQVLRALLPSRLWLRRRCRVVLLLLLTLLLVCRRRRSSRLLPYRSGRSILGLGETPRILRRQAPQILSPHVWRGGDRPTAMRESRIVGSQTSQSRRCRLSGPGCLDQPPQTLQLVIVSGQRSDI